MDPTRYFVQARLTDPRDIFEVIDTAKSVPHTGGRVYDYTFRGQSAKYPSLEPRADRPELESPEAADHKLWKHILKNEVNDSKLDLLHQMLIHYKRTIHNFQSDLPRDNDWLEWMSLIQHFGGPTRLLDFSDSPAVGAYFASHDADKTLGGFLWMFHQDKDRLEAEFDHCGSALKSFGGFWWDPQDNETWNLEGAVEFVLRDLWQGSGHVRRLIHYLHDATDYLEFFGRPKLSADHCKLLDSLNGAILVRPFRMNRRLLAQQGCFVTGLNSEKSLIEQMVPNEAVRNEIEAVPQLTTLEALQPFSKCREVIQKTWPTLVRIWIPPGLSARLKALLRQFNVTGQSLFPDFEGNTQAMNEVQRTVGTDVL